MAKKNKGGRPSVYDTRIKPFLREITALREKGISHKDIAKMLNIAESTYFLHKSKIEEFSERIKIGDEELVNSGKASLKKLVDGFERKITTKKYKYYYPTLDVSKDERIYFDEDLALEGIKYLNEETVRIEEIAPEPSSVYFALVNKTNGEFRHRQDVVVEQTEIPVQKSFRDLLLGNEDVEEQTDL